MTKADIIKDLRNIWGKILENMRPGFWKYAKICEKYAVNIKKNVTTLN